MLFHTCFFTSIKYIFFKQAFQVNLIREKFQNSYSLWHTRHDIVYLPYKSLKWISAKLHLNLKSCIYYHNANHIVKKLDFSFYINFFQYKTHVHFYKIMLDTLMLI